MGQQCTSTLSCRQARPNTAQPNTTLPAWRRGAHGSHRGSAQTHARGTGMPWARTRTHTYTHAQRERATGNTRPDMATGPAVSEHTGRRTDGHRTCFGVRGNALGGRSRVLTREQSSPGVALHKQQRHTMPRSRNAYDPTARDRGVGRSLILHLGTSSQGHLNSKGFEVRGNQVTEWGERAKKGAVEGKGGSESVRWERAAGWLCPGSMFKEHLGCESCVRRSVLHRQALPQSCRRETAHIRPL